MANQKSNQNISLLDYHGIFTWFYSAPNFVWKPDYTSRGQEGTCSAASLSRNRHSLPGPLYDIDMNSESGQEPYLRVQIVAHLHLQMWMLYQLIDIHGRRPLVLIHEHGFVVHEVLFQSFILHTIVCSSKTWEIDTKYRYLIWTSRVYSWYASEDTNIMIFMIIFEYMLYHYRLDTHIDSIICDMSPWI